MPKKLNITRSNYWIFGTMLVFGVLAFLAAMTLTLDHILQLKNASAQLSCDLNSVLSCGSVMKTWQASLFGFPNPLIGIAGFAIVVSVAMAGLAQTKFVRWYLITAQVFYTLGLIFSYWLFFQSVYSIQILCPWCLVVTLSTTLIFECLTRYNLRENTFGLAKQTNQRIQKFIANDYDKIIIAAWLVILALCVYLKFGDALFQ